MYYNRRIWRLSTPLDVLRFSPLGFIDRIRLGLLVLQVRKIKDWKSIEHLSIREWLEPICGPTVFRVMWEPLIKAKFSIYADDICAVWFWKKLVLRGSSRNKKGREHLSYFRGGFGKLAEAIVDEIRRLGGTVLLDCAATGVRASGAELKALRTAAGDIEGTKFLFTPALPLIADLFAATANPDWLASLRRVRYLGNVCLVLQLDRSLSDTYWLNVNDPGFPFVGVIEHTNFDSSENYSGARLAYLSSYMPTTDPLWSYTDERYFELALEHLKRMFPSLDRSWIKDFRVWRAEYAQPVTERHYSEYVPGRQTPFKNAHITTMAHIYPEDRGTNYAIREGRAIAEEMVGAPH
jgi:protoporphyrinogen oxidase